MASGPPLLLIANPAAQRVTGRRLRAVAGALEPAFRVEPVETKGRGHAQEIAGMAAADGFGIVAVLGGDGTLNEAVNGLAGSEVAVTVLPAGGADVFARSVGIPRDALAAARRLAGGGPERRTVPLGRIEDRWFASNFGMGFDAEVVRHVEARPRVKRIMGDSYFLWAGVRVFFGRYDRRLSHLRIPGEGGDPPESLFMAVVQNTDPYTFLGRRPLRLCPDASLGDGLHCFAIDTLRLGTVMRVLVSAFGRARHTSNPHVRYLPGRGAIRMMSDEPLPVQVDGEFVGDRTAVLVRSVPDALTVLA